MDDSLAKMDTKTTKATAEANQKTVVVQQATRKPVKRKYDRPYSDGENSEDGYSAVDSDEYFDDEEMHYDDDEDDCLVLNRVDNGVLSNKELKIDQLHKSNEFEFYFENLKAGSKLTANFDFMPHQHQQATQSDITGSISSQTPGLTNNMATTVTSYDNFYSQYATECFIDPNHGNGSHGHSKTDQYYANDYNNSCYTNTAVMATTSKSSFINLYTPNDVSTAQHVASLDYNQYANASQYSNADFFYTNFNGTGYGDTMETQMPSSFVMQTIGPHYYSQQQQHMTTTTTTTTSLHQTPSIFTYDSNVDHQILADQSQNSSYYFDQSQNFFMAN
jgi:hypothetical protein